MRDDAARSADASTGSRPRSAPDRQDGETASGPSRFVYVWDLLSSVGIVLLIGALLFTASGIWPPMVAVESGSMQPVLHRGDLVFVMDAHRFPGPNATADTGVVTYQNARGVGYKKFDSYGDVVVYRPNGNEQKTPIIHRARFWVGKGENWVKQANPEYLGGIDSCEEAPNCPTPYAGFITKGDHNPVYDQVDPNVLSGPVKPNWVIGKAQLYAPYLGDVRLGA